MNEKREPIAATRDDAAGGRHRSAAPRAGSRPAPRSDSGGTSVALNIVIAILVAGLVVAGWFIATQHEQLALAERTLEDAEARLVVLEDRLRVTDEAMSGSTAETQEQLGFWETEIRKLWDVSNKRNKGWIEANQKKVAALEKGLSATETRQRDLSSTVSRFAEGFERQQVVEDQMTTMNLQLQQLVSAQRDLIDQLNVARQTQTSLKSRVGENEQAVKAIDAYRLQVNGRLAELERQVSGTTATPGF